MTTFNAIISAFGLDILYIIFIFAISAIFIHYSNQNVFGLSIKRYFNLFIASLDLILFILVVGFLIYDIFLIVSFFINKFSNLTTVSDIICNMSSNPSSNTSYNTNNTNVGIDRNSAVVVSLEEKLLFTVQELLDYLY